MNQRTIEVLTATGLTLAVACSPGTAELTNQEQNVPSNSYSSSGDPRSTIDILCDEYDAEGFEKVYINTGDTLGQIALDNGMTLESLARINLETGFLSDVNELEVGECLLVTEIAKVPDELPTSNITIDETVSENTSELQADMFTESSAIVDVPDLAYPELEGSERLRRYEAARLGLQELIIANEKRLRSVGMGADSVIYMQDYIPALLTATEEFNHVSDYYDVESSEYLQSKDSLLQARGVCYANSQKDLMSIKWIAMQYTLYSNPELTNTIVEYVSSVTGQDVASIAENYRVNFAGRTNSHDVTLWENKAPSAYDLPDYAYFEFVNGPIVSESSVFNINVATTANMDFKPAVGTHKLDILSSSQKELLYMEAQSNYAIVADMLGVEDYLPKNIFDNGTVCSATRILDYQESN